MNKKKNLLLNWWAAGGNISDHPGFTYLKENARAFWDFNGSGQISSVPDLTGNGWNLSPSGELNTGVNVDYTIDYQPYRDMFNNIKAGSYRAEQNALLIPGGNANLFRNSHEVHMVLCGKKSNTQYIFGVYVGSTFRYDARLDNNGRLVLRIKGRAAAEAEFRSVNNVIIDKGGTGRCAYHITHLCWQINFEADTFKVFVNGAEIATEKVSGDDISSMSPTYYIGTWPVAIGTSNLGSASMGNVHYRIVLYAAVTNILPDDKRIEVSNFFLCPEKTMGTGIRVIRNTRNPILTDVNPMILNLTLSEVIESNVTLELSGDLIVSQTITVTPAEALNGKAIRVYAKAAVPVDEDDLVDIHGYAGRKITDVTLQIEGYEDYVFDAFVSSNSEIEPNNNELTPYICMMDGYANWRRQYPTMKIGDVANLRTQLADSLFKANYPNGARQSTTNVSGYGGVTFNVASPIRRTDTYHELDKYGYNWTVACAYATNALPSSTLVISCHGHGEEGHQNFYNALYAAGHDYAALIMPGLDNTDNPNISGTFGGHDSYVYMDTDDSYLAMRLFLFYGVRHIKALLQEKSYTKVVISGISGGCTVASHLSALLTEIQTTFLVRGANFEGLMTNDPGYEESDTWWSSFERYNTETTYNPIGRFYLGEHRKKFHRANIMALAGSGKVLHQLVHIDDTVSNWRGWLLELYGADLKTHCQSIGGDFSQHFNTKESEKTHGYQASEIAYIIDNI